MTTAGQFAPYVPEFVAGTSASAADLAAQKAFIEAGGVAGGSTAVTASQAAYTAAGGVGALTSAEIAAMTTAAGQFAPAGMIPNSLIPTAAGTAASTAAANAAGTAAGGAFGLTAGQAALLTAGLGLAGGVVSGNAAKDAANTQADAIRDAANVAADAAKFRPVGVTTRFGSSKFGYDANGNLTSAGYTLAPDLKAQQDQLMGTSNQMLSQFTGSQAATAPMGQAAQSAMALGNQYLTTSPQEQAQKYMAEQQALLATGRERDYAALQQRLASQGRLGLATGATSNGMMAANPELEAWNNAKRQQDLELAAKTTQGGMDYATFGAGMVGTGGDLLKSMYGTQTAAYAPYQTALGGAQTLEGLGQGAMDIGTSIGAKSSTAAANAGNATAQGMLNAANTMAPANAYSPWGSLLSGAGNALNQYNTQQQQQNYMFNPYTGVKL